MKDKPIRVLQVSGTMNRGGQETLIMELYRHIDRSKVQFDFLIYNHSGEPGAYDAEIRELGGKIFELKRKFNRGPLKFYKELICFFEVHKGEYNIVHSHQYKTSGFILSAAKRVDSSCITIAHSHIANVHVKKTFSSVLRSIQGIQGKVLLRKNADYYFGCADDALVQLIGKNNDNETRFVLRNAINCEKYFFDTMKRSAWRNKFQVDDDTLIVGNVARFTYQKNHELVIRIFARICSSHNNSLLVLLGVGEEEQQTKALAKELGILDKVLFMGSRPDVNEIINAFDLFLFPSRYEGLGIVLIEAQANGLPCVISKDVIPEEADVHSGLITRIGLEQPDEIWAQACLQHHDRLNPEQAAEAVRKAGYDINVVAKWLQSFYLEHWRYSNGNGIHR